MNFLYANEISKNGNIKDSNSAVAFVCLESQQKLWYDHMTRCLKKMLKHRGDVEKLWTSEQVEAKSSLNNFLICFCLINRAVVIA